MTLLEMDGELEKQRVTEWVKGLKESKAGPLSNKESLQIGEMEPADRDLVIALLRQHADIVEKKEGCPQLAKTTVEHHINTGDAAPIMQRRRRHAVNENQVVDDNVDNMLKDGVVEPGSGAWGFPVVHVRKKDGTVRFCIDYRALNAVTVKDVYPLPRVDETLEALFGSMRFTSLDLHAGYWQLAVAQQDRPKTAFTTRRGLFQFCRMPFGLCNAPGTFQRLMDCVLRGLTWVCCLVYLDDVIIFSKSTVARHVVELAVVLERLSAAGLSLKAAKCSFAETKMEYLGHDLTTEGIQPTPRLVKAVADFPRPRDAAEVRRFVALAGYYRRFLPSFGARMSPLTKLLRKASERRWGSEQEEAFAWAKAGLSRRPVLVYPNYQLPFKLTTDASKAGLGAVLFLDQGHGDQPIAYASKANSLAVAKYTISELECLAVVWAVKLFRPHLYGRKFVIVTDHVALKWLMTCKEPAGRLHRWALTLQEFDFEVVYRPGRENSVADALSRGPVAVDDAEGAEEETEEDDPVIREQEPPPESRLTMTMMAAAVAGRTPLCRLGTAITRAATGGDGRPSDGPAEAEAAAPATAQPEQLDTLEDEIDRAATDVVRSVVVQRVEAAELGIAQFTDEDVKREQAKSVMVQALKRRGAYRGQRVFVADDECMQRWMGARAGLPAGGLLGSSVQGGPRQHLSWPFAWDADVQALAEALLVAAHEGGRAQLGCRVSRLRIAEGETQGRRPAAAERQDGGRVRSLGHRCCGAPAGDDPRQPLRPSRRRVHHTIRSSRSRVGAHGHGDSQVPDEQGAVGV
jgi:hypothetical protein